MSIVFDFGRVYSSGDGCVVGSLGRRAKITQPVAKGARYAEL